LILQSSSPSAFAEIALGDGADTRGWATTLAVLPRVVTDHALAIEVLRIVAPRSLPENDGHSSRFTARFGHALSRGTWNTACIVGSRELR
jgi:hypothetical protein